MKLGCRHRTEFWSIISQYWIFLTLSEYYHLFTLHETLKNIFSNFAALSIRRIKNAETNCFPTLYEDRMHCHIWCAHVIILIDFDVVDTSVEPKNTMESVKKNEFNLTEYENILLRKGPFFVVSSKKKWNPFIFCYGKKCYHGYCVFLNFCHFLHKKSWILILFSFPCFCTN